ncbi:MAG: aldo/keto reductase [Pseudomonadota bacterium]
MLNRRDFNRFTALGAALAPGFTFAENATLAAIDRRGHGVALPVVGLGNSKAFTAADLTIAGELLKLFAQQGGGYVDLSGASRTNVGQLATQNALTDELFLGNYLELGNPSETREEIEALKKAQDKSALDLVNSRDVANFADKAKAYRALQEEGLVTHIGVASFGVQATEIMADLVEQGLVDFVQVNYSLMEPDAEQRLLPLAMARGVNVVVNRPFINGKYFDYVKGQALPDWAAEFDCKSWAQFALKYIIANPAVTCVITETANLNHARDNLAAGFGRLPNAAQQQKMRDFVADI